ncbi:hypothetical protein OIU34_20605 [Pararhizobium sp. BT-229]|uniref:hypothetical protein n=1 Tax=Pararhizobium sp. BT-229 TaxID=2986923 RepID=UPI0021F76F21|nr:hypothetical protein [Pararhizobium sp. BT-229]MCV9964291.1 hypothetical protein [Pararhizobium sp. BT-229]
MPIFLAIDMATEYAEQRTFLFKGNALQTPLEFFHEHLGSVIDPTASPIDVLMRSYAHVDPGRSLAVRMGGSEPARFLVSRDVARVWAPVRLPPHTDGRIEVAPTSARKRRDWLVDIIMSPPEPPFLAVSLGMAASDTEHWRPTVSMGMIVFAGAAALQDGVSMVTVERARFLAAKEWFAMTQVPVADLLRRRDIASRFRRGLLSGAAAQAAAKRIKTSPDVLDRYPGIDDPFQMKLASYAANEWEPQ